MFEPTNSPAIGSSTSSRSLTTLIRDLHAEFPELEDLNDDSWVQSLASDEARLLHKPQRRHTVPSGTPNASTSLSSLLHELELVATAVKTLPVPRPPSLSAADWEAALESPDSEYFGESILKEEPPRDVILATEEPSVIQPPLDYQPITKTVSGAVSSDSPFSETTTSDIEALEPQTLSLPPRSRSFKNVFSFKRSAPVVRGEDIQPPVPMAKLRSRGITYPNLNTKWRTEQNIVYSIPVEPVSFLLF
ncbi:hypothetical protein NM688_g8633 [Phlebia brevispora]|uniref:Uncharacterized protein n=1 Tax=Phlebia brevispora TaxID=194682 RepID=A0ACC1RT24_9APHY|nr:hypothetical protein NM688_g8633 [Phlebia brevispora]